MRQNIWLSFGFILLFGGLCSAQTCVYAAPATHQPDVAGGWASDRVVVRVRPSSVALFESLSSGYRAGESLTIGGPEVVPDPLMSLLRAWGVESVSRTVVSALVNEAQAGEFRLNRYFTLRVPAGSPVPQIIAALKGVEQIESAEPDGLGGLLDSPLPNDMYFREQYYLENIGQSVGGDVGTPGADCGARGSWEFTTGSPTVVVAVLDTGVSQSHPDLMGKLVPGQNFTATPPNANTDDSWFVSHGTGCAGIIAAASNNGIGMTGVSWQSRIMPIKIANTFGMSSESQCGNGLIWAADNGARVASVSLGFSLGTSFLSDSVAYAISRNVVVCASSGNTPGGLISFPARYPNVVSVGATNNRDELATFTSTGPELFICAPGIEILTTWDTNLSPNTYTYENGTSFACPIVAGVASLIMAADPALTSEQVRFVMLLTADDLGEPGRDELFGWGRVNARSAVVLATNQPTHECGADWNHDGVVNSTDLFAFLEEYLNGSADLNQDGRTDSDDLFEYLGHFFVGC